jgi:hypothetical protein
MHGFGYFAHCGSTLTLPTHRYHKNRGVYDVAGLLFAVDCRDFGQVFHICWHHSGDLYGFGHVMCDMPATLVGVSPWHRSLMVVLSPSFCIYWQSLWSDGRRCEVADCLGSDGAMRNHVVQLGVPICRSAALWWTHWSAILVVEFHIPWFQALLWLHVAGLCSKAYSKGFIIKY